MKTILAYGDSLTYGASPIQGGPRHAYEDRWPTRLESGLGGKARVIAEGLGGRTTVHDDWYADADRNGARILPTLLSSHGPLDMVVVMLGTNDLKHFLGATALEASYGVRRLVQIVRAHAAAQKEPVPKIILVAPPAAVDATTHPEMTLHFGPEAIGASGSFAQMYKRRAEEEGVGFFDAGTVAKTDPRDGIHLDAKNTRAIGEGLVPLVRQMLEL
ncbi:MAG TPA: SGNH/GDSL hydrolase family protein [Devosia sp.]|nr:SGNH/GDSL hydrolase family protein [Devosia sp.]